MFDFVCIYKFELSGEFQLLPNIWHKVLLQ